MSISFEELENKLSQIGQVKWNPYLFRLTVDEGGYELTLFPDGRAIIKGTEETSVAKTLYAKFIGT